MPPTKPEPQHDAFTRWWIENIGGLPTPDEVKKFKRRLEASNLLLDPDRYAEIVQADLLAKGDPEGGIPPFNAAAEAAAYARHGLDVRTNPDFLKLEELAELGRVRMEARLGKRRDPKAGQRARLSKLEKAIRKAKKTALRASKSCSKVSRRSPLRDEDRDRHILAEIRGFLDVGVGVRFTFKRRELVSPVSSSPAGRTTTHDPVIWLPGWSKASLPLRSMAMGIAAGYAGAVDFTLHLGNSGIAYGMGVGEMQFARRLHRRITDALDRKCPKEGYTAPDFFFLVEQGEGERPHLHGVIFIPASKAHQAHLRTTLCEAVGTDWTPTPREADQVDFGSLYEPAGWVKYITKYPEMTKASLGDNIFACSRPITQSGKAWYQRIRERRGILLPGKAVEISP